MISLLKDTAWLFVCVITHELLSKLICLRVRCVCCHNHTLQLVAEDLAEELLRVPLLHQLLLPPDNKKHIY